MTVIRGIANAPYLFGKLPRYILAEFGRWRGSLGLKFRLSVSIYTLYDKKVK